MITLKSGDVLKIECNGWSLPAYYVNGVLMTDIKVGDRVEAPRHGHGKVLAIEGGDAWVRCDCKDCPLTFDLKKLKLVPKLKTWNFDTFDGNMWRTTQSIELTPEVRERLKDLL